MRFAPLSLLTLAACLPELPKSAPSEPEVSIGPTAPRTTDDLIVAVLTGSTDADGAAVRYAYAWFQNGIERTDFTTDTVPADATTKDEVWEVFVTPVADDLSGDPGTASTTILNSAPEATVAFASTSPTTEDDLVAVAAALDPDGDPVTFTYAWQLADAPQPDDTSTISADRTEHGQRWAVDATPSDGTDIGAPAHAEVQIGNAAPVLLSVTLVPEAPYVTDAIVATVEATDVDSDSLTYQYTWYVDGEARQSGASDTLAAASFSKHQRISVEVVPNDGFVDGEGMISADVVAENSPPTASSAHISPETAYVASTLTCVPGGFADADGDPEAWRFAWTVNGTAVTTDTTLDRAHFSRDDSVVCSATPWDGEVGGASVESAPRLVSDTPPVLTGVTLSSAAPTEADLLSAVLGAASDDDGDTISYRYDWYVLGRLAGTGDTLPAIHYARGDDVYVVVTPWDGTSYGASVTSAVATVADALPVVTAVTLSPAAPTTDSVVTAAATNTDADGDPVSLRYTWYVDGVAMSTSALATLDGTTSFAKGQRVEVEVVPNDGLADGTSVRSAVVEVRNSAPTAPAVAIVPASPRSGEALTCNLTTPSTDADGDTLSYTWAWDRGGVAVMPSTPSTIPGADVGPDETWTCEVVASDGTDRSIVASGSVTVPPDTARWTQRFPSTSPSARSGASMAYDAARGETVLFGGYDSSGNSSETWVWDGSTWTRRTPATHPPAREGSAMTYDAARGEVVLFDNADTWTWNGTTWTQRTPARSPDTRGSTTMAYDPDLSKVVLYGGNSGPDGTAVRSDAWTWDGTTWTEVASGPGARLAARMAWDPDDHVLRMVQGQYGAGYSFSRDDTWEWSAGVWSPAATGGYTAAFGGLLYYDLLRGQMVLFGGGYSAYGTTFDTEWVWSGVGWTPSGVSPRPSARFYTAYAYDDARDELVMFGGLIDGRTGGLLAETWTRR